MSASDDLEERLRVNRRKFVKNLEYLPDVLDILLEFNILTSEQCQRINAEDCVDDKIRKLIDIVPTRADPDLVFYYALVETKQFELATVIRPDLQKYQQRELQITKFAEESIGTNVRSDQDYDTYQPDILPAEWPDLNPDHVKQRLNFEVRKAVKNSKTVAKFHSKLNYPMRSKPRGRVFIINNHFSQCPKSCTADKAELPFRRGTDEDEAALLMLFKNDEMMFIVDGPKDPSRHEVSAERMRTLLKAESKRNDHGDCFILCILSHGLKDAIYGTDGKYISVEEIVNMFDDENCPALAGKPKLFFIQACRGVEEEKYLKTPITHSKPTEQPPPYQHPSDIPPLRNHKNCFLAFATTSGSVSWRDEKLGSLFIQAVVRIFWEFAYKDEICSLMTKVNHLVNKSNYTVTEENGREKITYTVKQTSVCRNHLKKGFYFFPGMPQ